MIDLDKRRGIPGNVAQVRWSELADIDLTSVAYGDWIEGMGDLHDYAVVGFLHHLGKLGFRLLPPEDWGKRL